MTETAAPPLVARVAVDVSLPHLDRPFDYLVPEAARGVVAPGVRVRVRFAGRLRDGYVVEVTDRTEITTKLAALSKVVSPTPVLSPAQVELIRAVADHYAGTFADVVRLAVPPRHAGTENADQVSWPLPVTDEMPPGGLIGYPDGDTFLTGLNSESTGIRPMGASSGRLATAGT